MLRVCTMQSMPFTVKRRLHLVLGLTALAIGIMVASTGCSTLGYWGQAAAGHLALLSAAQPVQALLDDPHTEPKLKSQLEQAQRLRAFATHELALPDNRSYTAYADVGREAVVWNVFATPPLSLELTTWCYPLFGCAGYRGYFDKARAEDFAAELRAQGQDVYVAPVPAYSTLGWMNWAGGDPLLNTFIHWSTPELARLLFHELAHQVVYVKDDTAFNESFATAVERAGVQRWLERHGDAMQRAQWQAVSARREAFLHVMQTHRRQLQAVYASDAPEQLKRTRKHEVLESLRAALEPLLSGPRRAAYLQAPLGGAHLAAVAAYHDHVPAFEVMLAQEQGDWPRFYARVRALAQRPAPERATQLRELAAEKPLPAPL